MSAGSVAYITTGAPVPPGADAVVQVEDTEPLPASSEVKINVAATPGQDIRTVGSDVQTVSTHCSTHWHIVPLTASQPEALQEALPGTLSRRQYLTGMQGQECLKDGDLVGPAEVGILATVGAAKVRVHRCARPPSVPDPQQ